MLKRAEMNGYEWKNKMKNFLIIFVMLIGLGLNIQAQESAVKNVPSVCVLGNVVNAKFIALTESLTLTQAIEESGGTRVKKRNFFSKAKTEARIYRLIEGSKNREEISIDFGKIMKGKAQDIKLKPYDIIEVACPKKRCETSSRDMKLLFGKDIFLVD